MHSKVAQIVNLSLLCVCIQSDFLLDKLILGASTEATNIMALPRSCSIFVESFHYACTIRKDRFSSRLGTGMEDVCENPFDPTQLQLIQFRYGIKPLFWTVTEGRLLVAAEMKAFKSIAGVQFEWDVRSIADGSINFGHATTFKNIEKATLFSLETIDLFLTLFRCALATTWCASRSAPSRSSSTGTRTIQIRYRH